ncbi:hypothetical protein E2C01_034708 [Portunus trituberculatus]|uniref:Uncharacterized protein n=1 Tax=Portunus trituberculatus TaxID=210409 RepID=A0A5B7F7Q9_PORTR|nr:hypothetical protein [Portunus trituberculatus]
MGRHAPLVPWHPRGLHGQTPQQNQSRVVARGLPAPRTSTTTSISNFGGGCGVFFYREGLQAPPQPARSAMGRDTGIPEGKKVLAAQKRQKERQRQHKQKGTELWKVESTHSSLG